MREGRSAAREESFENSVRFRLYFLFIVRIEECFVYFLLLQFVSRFFQSNHQDEGFELVACGA